MSTTTCWRYVNETVELLAQRAPKRRAALREAKRKGYAYVVIDGTLIPINRIAADRPFYSGKHKQHPGLVAAAMAAPEGSPVPAATSVHLPPAPVIGPITELPMPSVCRAPDSVASTVAPSLENPALADKSIRAGRAYVEH